MFKLHTNNNIQVAELTDTSFAISETQDFLDLMGNLVLENCNRVIIHEVNLNPDFFRLPTGLAGDILQKASNYRIKLAIIGDFSKYSSKNLQDFIRESNRGNRIFFVSNISEALYKITN